VFGRFTVHELVISRDAICPYLHQCWGKLVLPAQLFGAHIDRSGKAKTRLGDDIGPAVAGSALADAYRDYARTAKWVSGDAVLYIGPDIDIRKVARWDRDVFAKIGIGLSVGGGKATLARLEATDTGGFVAALGNWVTSAIGPPRTLGELSF
jgi:hypothetical protein